MPGASSDRFRQWRRSYNFMRSLLQEVYLLPLLLSSKALKMAQLFGRRHHCKVKTVHLHTTAREVRYRWSYRSLSQPFSAFINASLVAESPFVLQHTRNTARKCPDQRLVHSFDDSARATTMAEEPLAQASAPMLRSDSQGRPPDAHSDVNHRRKRFARLSRLASPTGQLCLAYLIFVLCPGTPMTLREV